MSVRGRVTTYTQRLSRGALQWSVHYCSMYSVLKWGNGDGGNEPTITVLSQVASTRRGLWNFTILQHNQTRLASPYNVYVWILCWLTGNTYSYYCSAVVYLVQYGACSSDENSVYTTTYYFSNKYHRIYCSLYGPANKNYIIENNQVVKPHCGITLAHP